MSELEKLEFIIGFALNPQQYHHRDILIFNFADSLVVLAPIKFYLTRRSNAMCCVHEYIK